MSTVIGIDLGGTGLRVGLVGEDGALVRVKSFAHGGYPKPLDAVDLIARAVDTVAEGAAITGVGVGVAAWVERDTGLIARAPNLGWINVPFAELLHRRLGVPAVVHNDLNAIAWGEYRYGAAQGAQTALVVFVGTGVGSALVTNGELFTGSRGFGGEIGHIRVGPEDGPACGCGRRGCVESYIGGSGLARLAADLRARGRLPGLGLGEEFSVTDLERAAHQGDLSARALLEDGGDRLGRVLGSLITFLNPDVLLLGGGVWTASDYAREAVRLGLDVASHPDLRKSVRIVESALGQRAGVVGAADLARHKRA